MEITFRDILRDFTPSEYMYLSYSDPISNLINEGGESDGIELSIVWQPKKNKPVIGVINKEGILKNKLEYL